MKQTAASETGAPALHPKTRRKARLGAARNCARSR